MNNQEMLTAITCALLVAVVLLSPAACTANRHNQISAAIQAGADPLEAKCAIESLNQNDPVCITVAVRKESLK